MIKWLVKRCVIRLLREDPEFRREVIKAANPQWAWELQYDNRKNPPPMPSFARVERAKYWR
jgi:hypothetical protein